MYENLPNHFLLSHNILCFCPLKGIRVLQPEKLPQIHQPGIMLAFVHKLIIIRIQNFGAFNLTQPPQPLYHTGPLAVNNPLV